MHHARHKGSVLSFKMSHCDQTLHAGRCPCEAEMRLQDLRSKLVDALDATNTVSREVWKSFWSAQQRFFKLLCISMKVCLLLPHWTSLL